MKLSLAGLTLVLLAPACGSSAPALRPVDKGDDVDRFISLQENYATLIERAKTPADAVRSLDAYCSEHRATIDEVNLATQRRTADDSSPDRAKLIDSTERLATRLDKASRRAGWRGDDSVAAQVDKCLYGSRSNDAAPTVPDDGSPLGIAECDRYLALMTACIAAMPQAAQEAAMPAIAQVRGAWREAAASAPEALAEGCKSALESTRSSMAPACPGVNWN
ncbi:MAG: hypothetical protein U1F43_02620 [Myxococcota bacterium]